MKKYHSIEIQEVLLEDFIRQAPELIEPGLKFIDHQKFTTRGPLDVLLVDSGHALVVAELKVVEDDGMLFQGIDYYDYVLRNLEGFAKPYNQFKINTKETPRLFLIAPSFSVGLLERIKWIDIPISLFEFQCIEFEENKGEIIPVYKEVSAPGLPTSVEIYTLEDRFNYITEQKIREMAKQFSNEVQTWDTKGVSIEPIKYAISMKVNGRVFAYIEPRRKYFIVSTFDQDGKWASYPIHNNSDLELIKENVHASFNKPK